MLGADHTSLAFVSLGASPPTCRRRGFLPRRASLGLHSLPHVLALPRRLWSVRAAPAGADPYCWPFSSRPNPPKPRGCAPPADPRRQKARGRGRSSRPSEEPGEAVFQEGVDTGELSTNQLGLGQAAAPLRDLDSGRLSTGLRSRRGRSRRLLPPPVFPSLPASPPAAIRPPAFSREVVCRPLGALSHPPPHRRRSPRSPMCVAVCVTDGASGSREGIRVNFL